jgi:hypothetical protein
MGRLKQLGRLLQSGRFLLVLGTIRHRLYSDHLYLGLRRDTTLPFRIPAPPLSLTVRPIEPGDVPLFAQIAGAGIGRTSVMDRIRAAHLIESGVQTCYVAATRAGKLCYVQFLVDPSQNGKMRKIFGDLVLPLAADEALLEAALSLEAYRGRGIMLYVIPELAKKARELGLRWLIAFVSVANLPMLKGCQWTGFVPYVERRESYRFFRRRVTFRPLPDGTPYPFDRGAKQGEAGRGTTIA